MIYLNIFIYIIIILFATLLYYRIRSIEKYTDNENTDETTIPTNTNTYKYTLSLLIICKNEGMIIDEFVKHYQWQGVDHIYLIDNGSTDNMKDVLKPYIDEGYVSYYYLDEPHKQVAHYNTVYAYMKNETKWLIVCDADEYIYNRNKDENIASYVNKLDSNEISSIELNWKMFGSSDYKTQPINNIRTSFTWRQKNINSDLKSIVSTKLTSKILIHSHEYIKTNAINNPPELALNHYAIMSEEYFKKVKMTRGDVYNKEVQNIRDMKYFEAYDHKEEYDDELKNLTLFSIPAA
jgi:hypothetical protein